MTTRRFFNLIVNPDTKEFNYVVEDVDIEYKAGGVKQLAGKPKDEYEVNNLCVAAKLSVNEKSIVILDDLSSLWAVHADLFNAYGVRVLAFIAALSGPAFAPDALVERHFIIVNAFEGLKASEQYLDSIKKLYGYWSFNAFCIKEEPRDHFEIEEQVLEAINLAPPMDSGSGLVH